jgi:NAD(P)-dependent dehydrogenase (short-subunit alcohol dehydrogenase family)
MGQKVALIIGAGDASGSAIAQRFAREGYIACVVRRDAEKLTSLVAAIEAEGGKAIAHGLHERLPRGPRGGEFEVSPRGKTPQ